MNVDGSVAIKDCSRSRRPCRREGLCPVLICPTIVLLMLYDLTAGGPGLSLEAVPYGTCESEKFFSLTFVWPHVTALPVTSELACAATAFLLWDILIQSQMSFYLLWSSVMSCLSPGTFSTPAQPRAVAVGGDSTVFVVEVDNIEAVRSDQRVFNLAPKYTPSATELQEALSQSAARYVYILFSVAFVHLPHLIRRGSRVWV